MKIDMVANTLGSLIERELFMLSNGSLFFWFSNKFVACLKPVISSFTSKHSISDSLR